MGLDFVSKKNSYGGEDLFLGGRLIARTDTDNDIFSFSKKKFIKREPVDYDSIIVSRINKIIDSFERPFNGLSKEKQEEIRFSIEKSEYLKVFNQQGRKHFVSEEEALLRKKNRAFARMNAWRKILYAKEIMKVQERLSRIWSIKIQVQNEVNFEKELAILREQGKAMLCSSDFETEKIKEISKDIGRFVCSGMANSKSATAWEVAHALRSRSREHS